MVFRVFLLLLLLFSKTYNFEAVAALNGVEPWAWLTDVLERLLPWGWKQGSRIRPVYL